MKIYRIIEDGSDFYIKADSMRKAIEICEESYIDDVSSANTEELTPEQEEVERKYYHGNILESCELMGELNN